MFIKYKKRVQFDLEACLKKTNNAGHVMLTAFIFQKENNSIYVNK